MLQRPAQQRRDQVRVRARAQRRVQVDDGDLADPISAHPATLSQSAVESELPGIPLQPGAEGRLGGRRIPQLLVGVGKGEDGKPITGV